MKFTTTENVTYRAGIGNVPKPWIGYSGLDNEESIKKYFYDNIKCWDWDFGFDEIHDFVFEDGSAYRLEYSGWAEWGHTDEEDNGLKDSYHIEKISIEDANVPEKTMSRNWI